MDLATCLKKCNCYENCLVKAVIRKGIRTTEENI